MGETGARGKRRGFGHYRSTDRQSYRSANVKEHRKSTTRWRCSCRIFPVAFPTRHWLAGADTDRVRKPAQASAAQTNSIEARNPLSVIDSGWYWSGSNCNACKKERRKIAAGLSEPDPINAC